MQKIKVILDTDVTNEIDDQFAICYLINSLEKIDLQAITIAPFFGGHSRPVKKISEGLNLSYNITSKLLKLTNKQEYINKIYKGANKYFFESKTLNPAVEKIIQIAKANKKTVVIGIGAITNIALALYFAPEIEKKISVVWLGGNDFEYKVNDEFNFRQDVEAVKFVFKSNVDLTVIPCKNVAALMATTIYELNHYLNQEIEINRYLCQAFKDCLSMHRQSEDDIVGESKVLWDLSAIAYLINKKWFKVKRLAKPEILEDNSYKININNERKINFVYDIDRDKIYKDFFVKMGYKNDIKKA